MTATPTALAEALDGRYAVEREIGQGGMATVYLARDLKHRRPVALKVLRPELAAGLGPERFLREIDIAAQLSHPHILPLLDSGEAAGFLYYVMPFVDGESLRERLARSGALPVSDAVRILCEIADALAYAHARGVVHRDVKPDNVMLSGRHALVTDFGVAKAVSEATGREAVTTAGMALGTPAYMAPEQAAADPHVDLRADLYALGCVAYELLTGRPPFTAATPQAVLAAQVTQAPAPLGAQRPGLPSALEQALMRCLAKHPADRPQSAEEVLAALEPFSSPSGSTTPMAMRPPAPLPAFRRGKRVAFAVTALGALVVAGAAALALARRAPVPLALGRATQITFDRGLELEPALSQMASWWPTSSGRRIGFSSMCGR